ncbi:hypothetical protein CKAH01_02432 [Colletotrichum kahawae]|uniref:Uncharacterized protein n=1 Tax=Colletotrichum kahawae TaxID=34407 RepID=A0AAE0CZ21_COLKA|nr:hypothetical protein CKAH01_02432 [Colletotrichum kahawae]
MPQILAADDSETETLTGASNNLTTRQRRSPQASKRLPSPLRDVFPSGFPALGSVFNLLPRAYGYLPRSPQRRGHPSKIFKFVGEAAAAKWLEPSESVALVGENFADVIGSGAEKRSQDVKILSRQHLERHVEEAGTALGEP